MKRKQIIALVLSAVLAAGSAMPGSVLPAAAAEKEGTVLAAEGAESADPSDDAEEMSEEDPAPEQTEDAAESVTDESDAAESEAVESEKSEPEDAEDADSGSDTAEAADPGSEETESTDSARDDSEQAESDTESPEEAEDDEENPSSEVSAEADTGEEENQKETEETAESVTAQTGTTAAEAGNENHFKAYLKGFEDRSGAIYITLSPGEEREMQAVVEADDYSGVTYTWKKSDEVIRRVTAEELIEQNGTASVDSLWITGNSGSFYRLEVSDGRGNTASIWFETNIDNHFKAYPEGTKKVERQHPDSVTTVFAYPGEEITLHACVEADDREGITYEWYDDDYNLLEEYTDRDTITVTVDRKSSTYSCYVKDRYGNTGEATFYVRQEETFTAYPEGAEMSEYDGKMEKSVNLSLMREEEVTLNVIAEAEEGIELTYSWSSSGLDQEELEGVSGKSVTVRPESSQVYCCTVTDQYGDYEEILFDIKVNHFEAWPENELISENGERSGIEQFHIREGEKATLRVLVDGDDTSYVSYSWQKEDMETGIREDLDQYGSSIEAEAVYDDSYYCSVTDGYGNSTTVSFMFLPEEFVAYPENPVLLNDGRKRDDKELQAEKGEKLTLRVITEPEDMTGFHYQWYEQGTPIEGSEGNGSALTITADQQTRYWCNVTRDGSDMRETVYYTVRVQGETAPVISMEGADYSESDFGAVYYTGPGEECTMHVTVKDTGTADSKYSVVWLDEDKRVLAEGTDTYRCTVTSNNKYYCKVTNSQGRMTVHGILVKIDSGLTALPAGRTESNYDSEENLVQIFADPSEEVTLEVEASAVEGADLQFTWEGRAMDFKGDSNSGWQYFDTNGPKLTVTPGADTRYECIVNDRFGYYKTVRFDVIVSGKKDLSRTVIKLRETRLPYTGKPVEPEVSVLYKGQKLEKGKDYTLLYRDNLSPFHTSTVLVRGAGEFTGMRVLSFDIMPLQQKLTVTAPALTPNAAGKITVKNAKGHLYYDVVSGRDIVTVDSKGNLKALKVGTAKVLVGASSSPDEGYERAEKTITVKVLPAAPASLKAANMVTSVKLTWTNVPGATGYIIKRAGRTIKTISGGSTVSYLDTTASKNGTTYNYSIYAKASSGTSKQYARASVYRLTRPAFTSVTNGTSKAITLKWKKNAAVTGYIIEYSLKSDFSGAKKVTIAKPAAVSTTIKSLTKKKTYYVRIRVYKKIGTTRYYSLWSPARKILITK